LLLFHWRILFKPAFSREGEDDMAAGSLESRLSNIEELCIIIIIIVLGGGRGGGGVGPIGDRFSPDTSRMEALMRLVRPHGDPPVVDLARMPAESIENRLLEVNAELTRLRSHEAELNARLKELRSGKSK
jgi:hypothetical protein